MKTMLMMKCVLLVSTILSGVAQATVNNLTQATNHVTIQDAIDNAVIGDVIEADPGTYVEAINFLGKAITLRSASGDPTDTIIDGNGVDHVVQCVTSETAATLLQGFTITGGNANGGGLDNFGGGMYCSGASPTIMDCIFSGNSALSGAGMFNFGNTTLISCTFSGNTATVGGGIYTGNSSPTVTNCIFSGNSVTFSGGGIYNANNSTTIITNCTFSSNSADDEGGGIYNQNSSPQVNNCVFWCNSSSGGMDESGQIFTFSGSSTVSYSNIQSGWSGAGTGNIDADPLFVDADGADNIIGTNDDNLRLLVNSPCLDVGSNAAIPTGVTTDFDMYPRVVNCTVDMGAYEFNPGSFVDSDGDGIADDCDQCAGFDDTLDGDGDGLPDGCDTPTVHNLTQATDHFTLQAAIDASTDGDIIEAEPATYAEAIDFNGKAITLRSASGDPDGTIIDGTGHYHTVQCVSGEGPDTLLKGFTITGGNATGSTPNDRGGGMYIANSSSPTIRRCLFRDNNAGSGGGIYNDISNVNISDCSFFDNTAAGGGGMYLRGNPVIVNCLFGNNSATVSGAGMYFNDGNLVVSHCVFSNNSAPFQDGGGIFIRSTADHCVVSHCVFAGNSGDGLVASSNNFLEVNNCIAWGNSTSGIKILNGGSIFGAQIVSFSIIQGGVAQDYAGSHIIDADPLFVDADGADNVAGTADDDFRLQAGSPGIDAGLNFTTQRDLDGNARIVDDPATADTGVGFPDVVDMGAYEFGSSPPPCVPEIDGDINCDGIVNELDFALMALHWLETI